MAVAGLAVLALVVVGIFLLKPSKVEPQGAGEESLKASETVTVPEKQIEESQLEAKKEARPAAQSQPQGQRSVPPAAKQVQPAASSTVPQATPAGEAPRTEPSTGFDTATDMAAVSLAQARTAGPKANAVKEGLGKTSLFFRLATARETEAETYLARKKTTDARCLFSVVERLYRLSLENNSDDEKLKTLKRYAADLKADASREVKEAELKALLDRGQEAVKLGETAEAAKDVEGAAKNYVQASFLFEKARWASGLAKKK
jgi:hypothetical protein